MGGRGKLQLTLDALSVIRHATDQGTSPVVDSLSGRVSGSKSVGCGLARSGIVGVACYGEHRDDGKRGQVPGRETRV